MTLLREIQILLERTYGRTGINLEDFLLDRRRNEELSALADPLLRESADLGRVFLRQENGRLRMGIYFAPSVISALERENPQQGLTDTNVRPFMVFLEEIDHAVHAALKFRAGQRNVDDEDFVRDLEVMAKVDTYLVLAIFCAFFNPDGRLRDADRRWLRACVFDSQQFSDQPPRLRRRYDETNRLARRYVRHLDGLSRQRRTAELRRFQALDYRHKQKRVALLG